MVSLKNKHTVLKQVCVHILPPILYIFLFVKLWSFPKLSFLSWSVGFNLNLFHVLDIRINWSHVHTMTQHLSLEIYIS